MTVSSSVCRLCCVCAAALLVGCGDSQAGMSFVGPSHAGAAPSRMRVDKKKKRQLLYVSDEKTYHVDIYRYPAGTTAGTLTGFHAPQGLCTNGTDVWITDFYASEILEYSTEETRPIETLKDAGYWPMACSYDPTTGDVAVSNVSSTSSGYGDVAIYKGAKGTPAQYSCSSINSPYYIGYDSSGDLYVDGLSPADYFGFCGLPKGKKALKTVRLNQKISRPGQVQWDGKYVAVEDASAALVYQFTIRGTKGVKMGSTQLRGSECNQLWIAGNSVICPEGRSVTYYTYPAGGGPTKTISGLEGAFGATIATQTRVRMH